MPRSKRRRVSGPAKRDLADIGAYALREWGAAQKKKYLGQIRERFAALRETPGVGAARDEIADGLRSYRAGRHVIYYRETGSELVVLRVLHESMDPVLRLGYEPGRTGEGSR